MKKRWIFLLIIFLQFSCVRKSNDNENFAINSATNDYVIEETDENVLITKSENNNFSYTSISKSEYERLKANSKNEVLSFPQEKFNETEQGLSIKLSNGKTLSFVNNDGVECEACIETYRYVGFSLAHNIHVYSQKLYESIEFFLVNEKGVTYHIFGQPSFFKDDDLMFCSSGMLGIEAAPNGLQLYEIRNGNVKLVEQKDLTDWIPRDAFWISNDELVMEQDFPYNYEKDKIPPSKYIKIKIFKIGRIGKVNE
jgi:hypothetical protein